MKKTKKDVSIETAQKILLDAEIKGSVNCAKEINVVLEKHGYTLKIVSEMKLVKTGKSR